VSSGRVSTAGTLWDCRAGNGAREGGVLAQIPELEDKYLCFNASMVESSLPTRSHTAMNTNRGLTLQIVVLGNLRARTPSKMCSKNLQVDQTAEVGLDVLFFQAFLIHCRESDRSEDGENDNHGSIGGDNAPPGE